MATGLAWYVEQNIMTLSLLSQSQVKIEVLVVQSWRLVEDGDHDVSTCGLCILGPQGEDGDRQAVTIKR